jgi:signal transduction histidine kinase
MWIRRTIVVALLYAILGGMGLELSKERGQWPTIWLPSAVGLGSVILYGPGAALGVGLGALLLRSGQGASPVLTAISIAANTLEAAIGGLLLREYFGLPIQAIASSAIPRLVLTLALVTNVSAFVGISAQLEFGVMRPEETLSNWWSWWAGNAGAVLLLLPVLLWRKGAASCWQSHGARARFGFIAGISVAVASTLLTKLDSIHLATRTLLILVPYVLIMWAAFEMGACAVALGGACTGIAVSLATNLGRGPFATTDPIDSFNACCLFNLLTGTSNLWLSTLAWERSGTLRTLQQAGERLEQTVRSRTLELEERTQELQAFSYAVSHDLKAPLRGVGGWILALEEDCGDQLDPAGRRHLARIRSEAERMGTLIEGLLTLSRIGVSEIRTAAVDVSAIAGRLLQRLAEESPNRHVQVRVAQGVVVRGDPVLVEIALINLLENAWKFTSATAEARVDVLPIPPGEAAGFVVRDNGAGFDPSNRHRLFIPFQRFHRASEFPGTGIGLATVQRIARRHGGTVGVESAPGLGTTVEFRLPAYRAAERKTHET